MLVIGFLVPVKMGERREGAMEMYHMAMYLTKARTTQLIKLQYVIAVAAATGK
jgi:hypothetical protein